MVIKIYWALWATLGVVTLGLFAMGLLTWLAVTIIGAVVCTLVFTGMMCLTPMLVGPHAKEFQHDDAEPLLKGKAVRAPVREKLGSAAIGVQSHA